MTIFDPLEERIKRAQPARGDFVVFLQSGFNKHFEIESKIIDETLELIAPEYRKYVLIKDAILELIEVLRDGDETT